MSEIEPCLSNLFDLTGRVALVTGGAGLLGAEFCRTLAGAGAAVAIVDLDGTGVLRLSDSISTEGRRALAIEADITHPDDVRDAVESTVKAFGRLDILVNSAALDPKFDPQHAQSSSCCSGSGAFEDFPLDAWNQALSVNLTGAFLSCQTAVSPMLAQGSGVIINISSIYGVVGPDQRLYQQPEKAPHFKPVYYSVTKAAILGLTRYLAAYYAGKNIRVNALTPGGVYNGHEEAFVQAYSSRSILGRMAERNELNGALLFLASDASAYMTGGNLIVDGGWTAW